MMEMMTTTTFSSSSSSPFSNRNNPKTQLQKYSLSLSLSFKRHKKQGKKQGKKEQKSKKTRERSIFFQQIERKRFCISLSLFLFFFFFFLRERYQREERTIGSRLMERLLSLSLDARARSVALKKNMQSIKSSLPLLRFFPKRERERATLSSLCPGRENISWREKPKKRKTKSLLSLFFYLDANGLSSRGRRSDGSSVERD